MMHILFRKGFLKLRLSILRTLRLCFTLNLHLAAGIDSCTAGCGYAMTLRLGVVTGSTEYAGCGRSLCLCPDFKEKTLKQ